MEKLYGRTVWELNGLMLSSLPQIKRFQCWSIRSIQRFLIRQIRCLKNSNDAAIANTALYDYHNGLISDEANTGYTRLLEMADYRVEDGDSTRTVKNYNYEKFFDAISVSNGDKWDENHPTYTSYKPIGNLINRTEEQLDNARVSDRVRQFAISWYLDDEVKKLVQEVDAGTGEKEASAGATAYSEETYDLALRQAIKKAENY